MDKYEFNIKIEQMKKLADKGDYETAMKIAGTIDWKRVRNTNLLTLVSMVYEKNEDYQEAKELLLQAFERAPIGKRLLYKLTELAVKEGSIEEAEVYYKEFGMLAPDDSRQYLLRFMILKGKGAPAKQLIHSLEAYTNVELDEKWMYELAQLYSYAGLPDRCVEICDRIMLMFGLGKYVDKAMDLKLQYAPLSTYQIDLVENRDKYEARLRAVQREYGAVGSEDEDPEDGDLEDRYGEAGYYRGHSKEPEPQEEPDDGPLDEDLEDEFVNDEMLDRLFEEDTEDFEDEAEDIFGSSLGDELETSLQEDLVKENLAREVSRLSLEKPELREESKLEQTRVLDDLKTLGWPAVPVPGAMPVPSSEPVIEEELEGLGNSAFACSKSPVQSLSSVPLRQSEDIAGAFAGQGGFGSSGQEAVLEEGGDFGSSGQDVILEEDSSFPQEAKMPEGSGEVAETAEAEVESTLAVPQCQPDNAAGVDAEESSVEGEILQGSGQGMALGESALDGHMMLEPGTPIARPDTPTPPLSGQESGAGIRNGEAELENEAKILLPTHLMIEAGLPEEGLLMAMEALKQIRRETGIKNLVVKITGSKLSKCGVLASAAKLSGKDLVVEQAGDLSLQALDELNQWLSRNEGSLAVILIDSPKQMEIIRLKHSELAGKFIEIKTEQAQAPIRLEQTSAFTEQEPPRPEQVPVRRELLRQEEVRQAEKTKGTESPTESSASKEEHFHEKNPAAPSFSKNREETDNEEMNIDEFAQYACRYAGEIDCSITGKSMLALYERIEIMEEDGIALTRANAESLIEEAADCAEKPSLRKWFKNIFSNKYDKDGLLILKEEHFIY